MAALPLLIAKTKLLTVVSPPHQWIIFVVRIRLLYLLVPAFHNSQSVALDLQHCVIGIYNMNQ